jgi:hypothetical protein
MDDRVEELSEAEELDVGGNLDLAHREIACSTTAAIAVNRPPNRDGLEYEVEAEGTIDTGLADLCRGAPRKISTSSVSPIGGWNDSSIDCSGRAGSSACLT